MPNTAVVVETKSSSDQAAPREHTFRAIFQRKSALAAQKHSYFALSRKRLSRDTSS